LRIPTYQIYNVLSQYTRQLTDGSGLQEGATATPNPTDDIELYATLKRIEIIETINKTIKEAIGRVTGLECQKQANGMPISEAAPQAAGVDNGGDVPFVYNVIGKDHRKVKRTISVTRFFEP